MATLPFRFSALILAAAVQASSLLISLPAKAASALAAWQFSSSGELLLRTAAGARLQAFFEAGDRNRGPRVWIDFPGELSRSRSLRGSGPVREIRLGKPSAGETRLVIEFQPGVDLDPSQLKLIGTASNRWKLSFQGLSTTGLRPIGEGNLNRASSGSWAGGLRIQPSQTPVNAAGLPTVTRGKYRVVIDPGHGGPDPGAVGIRGIRESEIVLDISLQVARLLEAKGVQVTMTRTAEVDVDLPPRVSIANRAGANAFVSIHANAISMSRPNVNGIETFFYSESSARLATHLQQQMLNVSPGSPNRGVKRGRFFVIRRTTMPAALVEMGFVTGNIDSPRLATSAHRQRLALALATGILDFLKGVR